MAREFGDLPQRRYRNKERDRKVTKRRKETEPTRFYHATTEKLNVGDILSVPEGEKIFLADKPLPHNTIATERINPPAWFKEGRIEAGGWNREWDKEWNVYEVEPLGLIEYGAESKEIQVNRARVVRFVGDGRAMLLRQEREARKKGKTEKNMALGSKVHGVENVREGRNKVAGHGRRYWEIMMLKQKLKEKT
jgi:hypothetical protein